MFKRVLFIIIVFLILFIFSDCSSSSTPITQQEAKRIAETIVLEEKATINNFKSPEIEKLIEKNTHNVALIKIENKVTITTITDIKGKTVWKVTYNTNMDAFLGPINVYVDYKSGKIYGVDLRD